MKDVRVIVCIKLGRRTAGFTLSHAAFPRIASNVVWSCGSGRTTEIEVPITLEYNKDLELIKWGLECRELCRVKPIYVVESPHLQIARSSDGGKPSQLPEGLDFKRALCDFIGKMTEEVERYLRKSWDTDQSQAAFILLVPSLWDPITRGIIRQCCYEAGLVGRADSHHLQFLSYSEAAKMYCRGLFEDHNIQQNDVCIIVRFDEEIVEVSIHEVENNRFGRLYDLQCFEFKLGRAFWQYFAQELELSPSTIATIQKIYGDIIKRYLIHNSEIDLEIDLELIHGFEHYLSEEVRDKMKRKGWVVEFSFEDICDPLLSPIWDIIRKGLDDDCKRRSKIFWLDELTTLKYLYHKTREIFPDQVIIKNHFHTYMAHEGVRYGFEIYTDDRKNYSPEPNILLRTKEDETILPLRTDGEDCVSEDTPGTDPLSTDNEDCVPVDTPGTDTLSGMQDDETIITLSTDDDDRSLVDRPGLGILSSQHHDDEPVRHTFCFRFPKCW